MKIKQNHKEYQTNIESEFCRILNKHLTIEENPIESKTNHTES